MRRKSLHGNRHPGIQVVAMAGIFQLKLSGSIYQTSDDKKHEQITQESVFGKISSDTKTVGFYYSIDGSSWNFASLYRNNYPYTIGQSPVGDANSNGF